MRHPVLDNYLAFWYLVLIDSCINFLVTKKRKQSEYTGHPNPF
jgi:hypothetical protein